MLVKNRILFCILIAGLTILPVSAESLTDVTHPKSPSYRVGISELPETQYVEAQHENIKPEKNYARLDNSQDAGIADLTYADLSIKKLSQEIAQELEFEEQDMLADLSLLWQGAAMQSDTINFALYKLANPDADKPDEKSIKKVLTTIASMSTLVGASVGSPLIAGSSLIGGNILGIMSQDTKALNYKYTRVTDADMIILIRKVEDLQQNAVNLYYDYMSAKKQLDFAVKLVEERQEKFRLAQKNNAARELIVITDAYYRTALDKQRTAKSEFFAKRAALEQFVGNETFVQFEAELASRESGESKKTLENVEPPKEEQNSQQEVTKQQSETVEKESEETLAEKPKLRMLEDENQQEGFMTGLSSSIDSDDLQESSKNKTKVKRKKKTKELTPEEQAAKERAEAKKKDPTKGLIFLHNKKESVSTNSADTEAKSEDPKNIPTSMPVAAPKPSNPYGFAPLEEIRVPDLTKGGYSIHSEMSY